MRNSNWLSNLAKKTMAVVLSVAMIIPTSLGNLGVVAMADGEPAGTTTRTTITFDSDDDIVNLNQDLNNAKRKADTVINKDTGAKGGILALGSRKSQLEGAGVELANPFAGKTELQQSIADGLANAKAALTYSGTDMSVILNKDGTGLKTDMKDDGKVEDPTTQIAKSEAAKITPMYPEYTNGVAASVWVKIPKGNPNGADKTTPLFVFSNSEVEDGVVYEAGALTVSVTGQVDFQQGTRDGDFRRNAMVWQCDGQGNDPVSKAGEWVLVTVAIENDNVQVYFDGQAATMSVASNFAAGKSSGKNFNTGFHLGTIENLSQYSDLLYNYKDVFKNLTADELAAVKTAKSTASVTDYSKFTFARANCVTMIDWLTDENTTLYAGGLPYDIRINYQQAANNGQQNRGAYGGQGSAYQSTVDSKWYNYIADKNKGIQMDNFVFDYVTDDTKEISAVAAEIAADTLKNDAHVAPENNGNIDFETEDNILNMNQDLNHAKTEEIVVNKDAGTKSTVLTLGKVKNHLEGAGVELANPFAGATDLPESIADGLANAKAALTYSGDDFATILNKDGTGLKTDMKDDGKVDDPTTQIAKSEAAKITPMYPKYNNGVTASVWVKIPKGNPNGADKTTPLFVFSNSEVEEGEVYEAGALTVSVTGQVDFQQGTRDGDYKRNAMVWQCDGQGNDPVSKAGEWVLVTVAIENDGVQVYFDGQAATMSVASNFAAGKSSGKNFNTGFHLGTIENLSEYSDLLYNYKDVFKNLTADELAAVKAAKSSSAVTDYSKFTFARANCVTMINWLTDENTTLYAGGLPYDIRINYQQASNNGQQNSGAYGGKGVAYQSTADSKWYNDIADRNNGIQMDNFVFGSVLGSSQSVTDAAAAAATEILAKDPHKAADVSEHKAGRIDFELGDGGLLTEDASIKTIQTQKDGAPNNVLEVTKPVQLTNMLAGKTDIRQSLADALSGGFIGKTTALEDILLAPAAAIYYDYGDVDKDADVDVDDALAIMKHLVKITEIKDQTGLKLAAVSGDHTGEIQIADAIQVLKIVVSLEEKEASTEVRVAERKAYEMKDYDTVGRRGIKGLESYPTVDYSNGAVLSAWVQVPADATNLTPLFVFQKDNSEEQDMSETGYLAVMANGNVLFVGGSNNSGDFRSARNKWGWINTSGKSPLDKKGEWVYITVGIQNNGVSVYFNGEKAELKDDMYSGGSGSKHFNAGFKTADFDAANDGDIWNSFKNVLKNFSNDEIAGFVKADTTEKASNDQYVFGNYGVDTPGCELLIDWLTASETTLYAGGTENTAFNLTWQFGGDDTYYLQNFNGQYVEKDAAGNEIEAAKGVLIDDVTVTGAKDFSSLEVEKMYSSADKHENVAAQ